MKQRLDVSIVFPRMISVKSEQASSHGFSLQLHHPCLETVQDLRQANTLGLEPDVRDSSDQGRINGVNVVLKNPDLT
jgi:hypothetical protein